MGITLRLHHSLLPSPLLPASFFPCSQPSRPAYREGYCSRYDRNKEKIHCVRKTLPSGQLSIGRQFFDPALCVVLPTTRPKQYQFSQWNPSWNIPVKASNPCLVIWRADCLMSRWRPSNVTRPIAIAAYRSCALSAVLLGIAIPTAPAFP